MKVLIIYPKFYIFGGGELLVVRLCNHLTRQGIHNAVLTMAMMPEVERNLEGTEIFVEENPQKDAKAKEMIEGEIHTLRKGLQERSGDFDLINPHNFPAEIACFKSPKPVVWMCNEPELYLQVTKIRKKWDYFRKLYLISKFLLKRRIRHAVVSDDYNAKRFKSIYGFKPRIINYGIDHAYFSERNPDPPETDPALDDRFVLLHVGMLTMLKNQMASLETVQALKEKIPNILVAFAGSGWDNRYKRKLNAYIEANRLEKHVLFMGHVDREKLKELYFRSDLMLHPIEPQGGWLSPFEMLCAGKPIIVSPDLTASGLIEEEGIGTVTRDYAGVVLDLHEHRGKYLETAAKGKKFVKENLTWNRFCEKMVRNFETVLKG